MKLVRENIVPFWKPGEPNGLYSQWYRSSFIKDGITYCCNEQYMMYQKALLFNDLEVGKQILNCNNPKIIKALEKTVKNFDSKIWDENKNRIVYEATYEKFTQNEELKQILLDSEDKILIEASPIDKIWGVGLSSNDDRILDTDLWQGQNLLGQAIMKVRGTLKAD